MNCTSLTDITLPNSITKISDGSFASTGLTGIIIPNSVETIGWEAFAYCNDLASVTIGSGVTFIKGCAFQDCTYLFEIVSLNPVPPALEQTGNKVELAFHGVAWNNGSFCELKVPVGSETKYDTAWNGNGCTFEITGITLTSIVEKTVDKLSVTVTSEGIQLTGCQPYEKVSIYTLTGQKIYENLMNNGRIAYLFPKEGIYIVCCRAETFKIIVNPACRK